MSFDDSGDTIVAVDTFDNLAINARVSKEQRQYEANETKRENFENENWDRQEEIKAELAQLQNEEQGSAI